MALKTDWLTGDEYTAADQNATATAVNAAYVKPGDGIPKGDFTASVQSSLDLADTAMQSGVGQPYDLCMVAFSASTTRIAASYGDFPFGVKVQRNITLTAVTFRVATADASGNLVVELRKNGVQIAGTSTSIAAANQVAGGKTTGTWNLDIDDVLTVYVTAVGTTPGVGLIADIKGVTR